MSGGPPASSPDHGTSSSFQRIPSESSLVKKPATGEPLRSMPNKSWERSQSALNLENKAKDGGIYVKQTSNDYTAEGDNSNGSGKVSEQSTVYWDLSKVDDGQCSGQAGGKFKISLQTIHQKEEMSSSTGSATSSTTSTTTRKSSTSSSSPNVSIQARVVRRMSTESSTGGHKFECTLPAPRSPETSPPPLTSATSSSRTTFSFTTYGNQKKPNLTITLESAAPVMMENIKKLRAPEDKEKVGALHNMLDLIEQAWAMPTIGRDLAYGLCDILRDDGGLDVLIENCDKSNSHEIQLESARLLAQSMTVSNRDAVAKNGLEIVVRLASKAKEDVELTQAATGILESLFKHSEDTCSKAIELGGLDSILYSCRACDIPTLRHCAVALANLAIYGGTDNQSEMIAHKACEWLFPLAFSQDDSIRYYAFLAIATLSANKELESSVVQSGTLSLVEPFIKNHDPVEFAKSDKAHIHGQSAEWLRRLVPLLSSKRDEAQSLAAFHFAMEAGIKAEQGKREVIFYEIEAISPLKRLASSTNKLASKFAAQALRIIGEEVPHQLSPQVPLWSVEDVLYWLEQSGFADFKKSFENFQVDGDILLELTDEHLQHDLEMTNGITRKRFLRELKHLKMTADYQSVDFTRINDWIKEFDPQLRQYVYDMVKHGADRKILRWLTEDHLKNDCHITNGIHRLKLIEAAKRFPALQCTSPLYLGDTLSNHPLEKCLDCFISYRRSNGSQLASLLKVHLQLRGFTVFLDIEKLRAGKFDDNLLNSVRNARNFVLVLTPNSLDRCYNDSEHKDWVHREVVAAIEGGCNIIPVMDNFQFPNPEALPEDMRNICFFNGIRWIHDYQDACVDKLEKFISGELSCKGPRPTLSKGNSLTTSGDMMHGSMYGVGGSQEGEGV